MVDYNNDLTLRFNKNQGCYFSSLALSDRLLQLSEGSLGTSHYPHPDKGEIPGILIHISGRQLPFIKVNTRHPILQVVAGRAEYDLSLYHYGGE